MKDSERGYFFSRTPAVRIIYFFAQYQTMSVLFCSKFLRRDWPRLVLRVCASRVRNFNFACWRRVSHSAEKGPSPELHVFLHPKAGAVEVCGHTIKKFNCFSFTLSGACLWNTVDTVQQGKKDITVREYIRERGRYIRCPLGKREGPCHGHHFTS